MKVIIFGATGSIGQSALKVIREQRKQEDIQIIAITGNNNVEQLCRDAIEFNVERVVTANDEHLSQLRNNLTPYEIEVSSGLTVMEGAIKNNIPGIDADCGGACACATCHVYINQDWVDKLNPKEDTEEDMLDFAFDVKDNSRLSCQISVLSLIHI